MLDYLNEHWKILLKDELSKEYFKRLTCFVDEEYKTKTIFPPKNKIFNALNLCDANDIKIVIIGQDPYINLNQANGLAFSVDNKIAPPSLKNIFKAIEYDLQDSIAVFPVDNQFINAPINKNLSIRKFNYGNLDYLAVQGVLFLNPILTVQEKKSLSHKNKGWEIFTKRIIEIIQNKFDNIIFMLWGAKALEIVDITKPNHFYLINCHPSPLSYYKGFETKKHFSLANSILESLNKSNINWFNNAD